MAAATALQWGREIMVVSIFVIGTAVMHAQDQVESAWPGDTSEHFVVVLAGTRQRMPDSRASAAHH